ncbi:unnamed protein product [Periconia digitata]|uniref:Uncharacterized protein n=1 Tax=Periconia digitata TaxID=1303443 RepID=A0A9W4UVW2_9PLEO|nr:unnamed protein product [Periconia digitata]
MFFPPPPSTKHLNLSSSRHLRLHQTRHTTVFTTTNATTTFFTPRYPIGIAMEAINIRQLAWLVESPFPPIARALPAEALLWLENNRLHGYRGYLISQLHEHLDHEKRLRLWAILNTHGWPTHLQSFLSAKSRIVPGTPWTNADNLALVIARDAGLPFNIIAYILFEGRSESECASHYDELLATGEVARINAIYVPSLNLQAGTIPFPEYDDSGFNDNENQPQISQHVRRDQDNGRSRSSSMMDMDSLDTPTPIVAAPVPQSKKTQARLAQLIDATTDSELSSARSSLSDAEYLLPLSGNHRLSGSTDNNDDVAALSAKTHGAPQTSTGRLRGGAPVFKRWDNDEMEILKEGVVNGMTPQELQAVYFPFRQVPAIRNKIAKSRRDGIDLPFGKAWSAQDAEDLDRLRKEGRSWGEIAAIRFPSKTGRQCMEYHRYVVLKQASETQAGSDDAGPLVSDKTDQDQNKEEKEEGEEITDIETARTNALNRLFPDGCFDDKMKLREAFNNSSWPSWLSSLEAYRAGPPQRQVLWVPEDDQAIICVQKLDSRPAAKKIVEALFPNRSVQGVRNRHATLKKRECVAGSSNMAGNNCKGQDEYQEGSEYEKEDVHEKGDVREKGANSDEDEIYEEEDVDEKGNNPEVDGMYEEEEDFHEQGQNSEEDGNYEEDDLSLIP